MLPRSTRSWLVLAALCGVLCALTPGADATGHNIPSHLIECYQNQSLYHRENRLSSLMTTVISLLKQVEDSPGFTMDARSFALSLLHMFRVDGIERDPEVQQTDTTIPFGLTGQQYFKHHILLQNLIPRSSFLFPNETLSSIEKCSLHFMMSNSLDKIARGDESVTCSVVGYNVAAKQRRQRRNFDDLVGADSAPASAAAAAADSAHDDQDDGDDGTPDDAPQSSVDVADPPAADETPSAADAHVADAPDAPVDADADAVAAADPNAENQSAPQVEDAPSEADPDAEVVLSADSNSTGPAPRKGDLIWDADGPGPRGRLQAPAPPARVETPSDCPVENGVVYTRWGSVQLGTLLAGIATGFETQAVPIKDILAGSRAISGLSDSLEIDNRYAATLAGDLAEIALWRGPKQTVKVGASGNWNSTQAPRWYFVQESNEMTDAEIRGGLDGLIMAYQVIGWNTKANGQLRLSTILERYYSLRGMIEEKYRACDRQDHYKDVAQSTTLNAQATSFASALYQATPSAVITSVGLSEYASIAVEALDKTVRASAQMETNCQATVRSSGGSLVKAKMNLIFVADCGWNYDTMYPALLSLAQQINVDPLGSKITVLGGSNHEVLFNTSDKFHTFDSNMRQNKTIYSQCVSGMKLNDLLDNHLRNVFTDQLEEEKLNTEASVHSNVVVLMPDTNFDIGSTELRQIETRIDEYRTLFPDVKFIFFTPQQKESYKIMVEDYEKDIILFSYSSSSAINTYELADRLKTVPQRIANPVCGANWKESTYNTLQVYEAIPSDHIAFYRIHPKYLFGIGSETIKIREQNKGTVTVCYSRTNELPQKNDDANDAESDDTQCSSITSAEIEIQLNNPCSGSSSYKTCNPLYISVEVTESKNNCNENTFCSAFDDVAVEFQHSHLTCGAAALRSPITLAAVVILMISKMLFS